MKKTKRLALLLAALLPLLCACQKQSQPYQKLLAYFENLGYTCQLAPLADENQTVPIYRASAWQTLTLNGAEQVLVYFDESNRADYLAAGIDPQAYGCVSRFGLRFVLVYDGADQGVLDALAAM